MLAYYQIEDLLEAFKIDMVVEKYGEQNKDTTQLHKTLHYVKIQFVKKNLWINVGLYKYEIK